MTREVETEETVALRDRVKMQGAAIEDTLRLADFLASVAIQGAGCGDNWGERVLQAVEPLRDVKAFSDQTLAHNEMLLESNGRFIAERDATQRALAELREWPCENTGCDVTLGHAADNHHADGDDTGAFYCGRCGRKQGFRLAEAERALEVEADHRRMAVESTRRAEAKLAEELDSMWVERASWNKAMLKAGQTLAESQAREQELRAAYAPLLNPGTGGLYWMERLEAALERPSDQTALREFGLKVAKLAAENSPPMAPAEVVDAVLKGAP